MAECRRRGGICEEASCNVLSCERFATLLGAGSLPGIEGGS